MNSHKPHGYPVEGDRLKLAIAFEQKIFDRLCADAEERGATVSDHVNWLLEKGWRLERHFENIEATRVSEAQALREKEKKSNLRIKRAAWEAR